MKQPPQLIVNVCQYAKQQLTIILQGTNAVFKTDVASACLVIFCALTSANTEGQNWRMTGTISRMTFYETKFLKNCSYLKQNLAVETGRILSCSQSWPVIDKHGQLWHFSHYLDDNFIWKWMGCDAKRPQKDYSSSGSNLPFWNCNQRQVTIHWAVEGWCVYLNLILSPEYFFVHGPFLCEWIK